MHALRKVSLPTFLSASLHLSRNEGRLLGVLCRRRKDEPCSTLLTRLNRRKPHPPGIDTLDRVVMPGSMSHSLDSSYPAGIYTPATKETLTRLPPPSERRISGDTWGWPGIHIARGGIQKGWEFDLFRGGPGKRVLCCRIGHTIPGGEGSRRCLLHLLLALVATFRTTVSSTAVRLPGTFHRPNELRPPSIESVATR
jgi:hypothetical protein